MAGQLEDYRAAMAAAARLPGVDPRRLVLWGVSLAGGHVLAAAAGRDDVAAVVSLTPLVDGRAAGRLALKHHPPSRDAPLDRRRRPQPGLVPARARAGADADRGPPRRARRPHPVRPLRVVPRDRRPHLAQRDRRLGRPRARLRTARPSTPKTLRCPVLVQIADFDRSAPPQASAKAAVGRPRRGAALPVRPLRRLARQRLVRAGPRPPARASSAATWRCADAVTPSRAVLTVLASRRY